MALWPSDQKKACTFHLFGHRLLKKGLLDSICSRIPPGPLPPASQFVTSCLSEAQALMQTSFLSCVALHCFRHLDKRWICCHLLWGVPDCPNTAAAGAVHVGRVGFDAFSPPDAYCLLLTRLLTQAIVQDLRVKINFMKVRNSGLKNV